MTIASAITRWIGCLTRLAYTCLSVWSAAAMLPRQPCSRSSAWHIVDPAGNKEAVCARHDHGVGR